MNEDKLIYLLSLSLWCWVGIWGYAYWFNKQFKRYGIAENFPCIILGPLSFIFGAIFYNMFKDND